MTPLEAFKKIKEIKISQEPIDKYAENYIDIITSYFSNSYLTIQIKQYYKIVVQGIFEIENIQEILRYDGALLNWLITLYENEEFNN